MKRYILVFISLIILSSCSLDDDTPNQHFEYIKITEVDIPAEFTLGETYEIVVSYSLPNECYQFYNHDYLYEGTSRIIGAIAIVNDDATCTQGIIEGEFIMNVEAIQSEPYLFKFWQGTDNQGTSEYLTVEVPVI